MTQQHAQLEQLASLIVRRMTELNWTVRALSEVSGCSKAALWRLRRTGRVAFSASFFKLAQILGIELAVGPGQTPGQYKRMGWHQRDWVQHITPDGRRVRVPKGFEIVKMPMAKKPVLRA